MKTFAFGLAVSLLASPAYGGPCISQSGFAEAAMMPDGNIHKNVTILFETPCHYGDASKPDQIVMKTFSEAPTEAIVVSAPQRPLATPQRLPRPLVKAIHAIWKPRLHRARQSHRSWDSCKIGRTRNAQGRCGRWN